jgi:hypothetical protein
LQRTVNITYEILTLTKSTFLTTDMILLCTKKLPVTDNPHSLFHREVCNPVSVQCHLSFIWPSVHPLSLTYTSLSPSLLSSVSPFYTDS